MGAMNVSDLDTPVVTIDLDVMERTITRAQEYYDAHGIAFRPHIKTHKIPAIAHLQVAAGAKGITCPHLKDYVEPMVRFFREHEDDPAYAPGS